MKAYLQESKIINYAHPDVAALAKRLAKGCVDDEAIVEACFLFVRDEIAHSGDVCAKKGTCTASEVLAHKTGWCYAKSHLLAALLRANGIPTGFCYQRLTCDEYEVGSFCLHGLNALYLPKYGWYRIDARGNKAGVDAQFCPPHEKLAFVPAEGEYDLPNIYAEPLPEVVEALQKYGSYDAMVENFPDVDGYESAFCSVHYDAEQNAILCRWKSFCEGDAYREPLEQGLQMAVKYQAQKWISDTRDGFESSLEDTKWLVEHFIPKASSSGIKSVSFILEEGSFLENEIDQQAKALAAFFEVDIVRV